MCTVVTELRAGVGLSVPLLHVLGMHIKVLSESYYADVWSHITGHWLDQDSSG